MKVFEFDASIVDQLQPEDINPTISLDLGFLSHLVMLIASIVRIVEEFKATQKRKR